MTEEPLCMLAIALFHWWTLYQGQPIEETLREL